MPRTSKQASPVSDAPRRTAGLPVPALLARLHAATTRLPRLEMEELLRRGPAVAPALVAALASGREAIGLGAAWPLVVLGKLGDPAAAGTLAGFLADADPGVAEVAAEALAGLGEPAVSALLTSAADGTTRARAMAYGALGATAGKPAHTALLAALGRDALLIEPIAAGLVRQGRQDALGPLHAALLAAHPARRPRLERAIVALAHGSPPPRGEDWRLRYRPLPRLGWRIAPGPLALACMSGHRPAARPVGAPRSLVDILADPALRPAPPRCTVCGGRLAEPTGLPLCDHLAGAVLAMQQALVVRWRAAGIADAWAALDRCDQADTRLLARPRRSQRWRRALASVALGRATLHWLVASAGDASHTALRTGQARLAAVAAALAPAAHRTAPAPQKYSQ